MGKQANIGDFDGKAPFQDDFGGVRLKHLAQINPPKSEVSDLDPDTDVSFVALEDFGTNGEIQNTEPRSLEDVYDGYTYFREGDIAIAKITPSFENGKGAICRGLKNEIGFGTTELHVLRPRSGVSTEFLWCVLRSKPFVEEAEAVMRGVAGQKRVPSEFLKEFQVPESAVREGDRIVRAITDQLERIDLLLSKCEELCNLLRSRQQSLISTLFERFENEDRVKLKYLSEMLAGYAFPSEKFSNSSEDINLLRGVNIGVGETKWGETEYWGGDLGDFDEYRLKPGDVVLAMDRPWINEGMRIAQLSESDCPSLLVQRVLRIRTNEDVLQEYVRIALESIRFKQYFDPILTGVSVPHISKEQVGNFAVPLPSIEEQRSLVSEWQTYRSKREKLENRSRKLTEKLQEKRQALLTAAVTGQIDVSEVKEDSQESL